MEDSIARPSTHRTRFRDRLDAFRDERLDHEVRQGLPIVIPEALDALIRADERLEPSFVEVFRPSRRVATGDHRELERPVGHIDDALRPADGVEVEHGHDLAASEEKVARMPVGVNDPLRSVSVGRCVRRVRGGVIGAEESLDEGRQFRLVAGIAVVRAERRSDRTQTGSNRSRVVKITARRETLQGQNIDRLMKPRQGVARRRRFARCLLKRLTGDELVELVHLTAVFDKSASPVACGNNPRRRISAGNHGVLHALGEPHAVRMGPCGRPAFQ